MIDIKVIVKTKHESLGGRDMFELNKTRDYSCICTSSSSELYFMPKEDFLGKVPNLDVIKDILLSEYDRIIERYKE